MGLYENKYFSQLFKLFMNTILHCFYLNFQLEKKNIRCTKKCHQHQKTLKYKNTNLSKQRKAKRDYCHERFEIHMNDLRNIGKIIKEMIGKMDQHKVIKRTTHLIQK